MFFWMPSILLIFQDFLWLGYLFCQANFNLCLRKVIKESIEFELKAKFIICIQIATSSYLGSCHRVLKLRPSTSNPRKCCTVHDFRDDKSRVQVKENILCCLSQRMLLVNTPLTVVNLLACHISAISALFNCKQKGQYACRNLLHEEQHFSHLCLLKNC